MNIKTLKLRRYNSILLKSSTLPALHNLTSFTALLFFMKQAGRHKIVSELSNSVSTFSLCAFLPLYRGIEC